MRGQTHENPVTGIPTASQISGGHKYLPPKQDVNAPDLYIPAMGVGSYCILLCLSAAASGKFKPETMTAAVGTIARTPYISNTCWEILPL